jgi:formate dehydrogenase major subunit
MIKITVNSKVYELNEKDIENKTLWQFLKENNYYIPILCNHENLNPVGRCRLCVVKVGNKIRTSCISPIEDGMDIITDDEDLRNYRKWALHFLFGARNHYCMYCAVTSHCEFQNLGYYVELDHFNFPTFFNKYELDNSHNHILFDNNRCVLCDRCVRVCSEVGGHFVLQTVAKGIERLVLADGGKKLGESSCVSCGLCVQVCPTGTLLDKYTLYLDKDSVEYSSYCHLCPIGCGIKIHSNKNNDYIVKIYSDFNAFSGGLICYKMRYDEVINYRIYKNKKYNIECIDFEKFKSLLTSLNKKLNNFFVIIDGTLTNEELKLINDIFSNKIYIYYPIVLDILNNPKFNEIDNFENYLIINIDLDKYYGALGSVIKRNVRLKNKNLILYNINNPNYLYLSKLNIKKIEDFENIRYLNKNLLIILDSIDYIKFRNEIKNLFTNGDYKFFILPIQTNDLGIIHNINNFKLIDEDKEIKNYKNVIIFSRDLKNINSKILELIENKSKIIFTLKNDTNLEIISKMDNVDTVNYLSHLFDLSASFYNTFNMLLNIKSIFKN